MTRFFIQPRTLRPDFRLVITFLWEDLHNVDTDGDAENPSSREWTELYCMDRECEQYVFEVDPAAPDPLTLRIQSEVRELAARVAWFLATQTQSKVGESETGPWHDPDWLIDQCGTFELAEASGRVARSRWQRATPEDLCPQAMPRPIRN